MEERGGKTIMCSVLFLDIVEYSKKSVAGQISLKDRFNSYLSAAISNVPMADRIILDTGDGAAINFLGDVEDALKAALNLRESMLNEDPDLDPPLLVRAGINLGPVRLVRDINGQPNIVGDGINVAQRVMGFAEVGQILVSRSYYDAVSRLSPQYAGMFHYQGSRTDKHVREHEVYAIGYPGGDKTTELAAASELAEAEAKSPVSIFASIKDAWNSAAAKLDGVMESVVERFRQADPKQRDLYIAVAAIMPVLLVGMLVLKLVHTGKVPFLPGAGQVQGISGIQSASAVVPVVPAATAESKTAGTGSLQVAVKPDARKSIEGKPDGKKASDQVKHPAAQRKARESASTDKKTWIETLKDSAEQGAEAHISISCKEGTQLFVDGALKGKVVEKGLTVAVPPGKHTVIVSSASGVLHTQSVEVMSGKTVHIRPKFCD
jgi:class 3 adenylate cyclase